MSLKQHGSTHLTRHRPKSGRPSLRGISGRVSSPKRRFEAISSSSGPSARGPSERQQPYSSPPKRLKTPQGVRALQKSHSESPGSLAHMHTSLGHRIPVLSLGSSHETDPGPSSLYSGLTDRKRPSCIEATSVFSDSIREIRAQPLAAPPAQGSTLFGFCHNRSFRLSHATPAMPRPVRPLRPERVWLGTPATTTFRNIAATPRSASTVKSRPWWQFGGLFGRRKKVSVSRTVSRVRIPMAVVEPSSTPSVTRHSARSYQGPRVDPHAPTPKTHKFSHKPCVARGSHNNQFWSPKGATPRKRIASMRQDRTAARVVKGSMPESAMSIG